MRNTKLKLFYRDADNYKAELVFVFKGRLSKEQMKKIADRCDEDYAFIAHQVGLPTPSEQFLGLDNYPNDDCDHVWTQLPQLSCEEDIELDRLYTDETPTSDLSVEQLTIRFLNIQSWDILGEWKRLTLL